MAEAKEGYLILSCMDRDEAFAIPYSWLAMNKKNLNMTENGERSYWHIAVTSLEGDQLAINVSKVGNKTAMKPYSFATK